MRSRSIYSWRSHPNEGWIVNEKRMHPPNAYTDEKDFIKQFAKFFPKKGTKVLGRLATCHNELSIKNFVDVSVFKMVECLNKNFPNPSL